jgi:hypothetical protein
MSTAYDEQEEVQASLSTLGGAAEIDVQVSTARRYPRSVSNFVKKATELATLSPEIAAACVYALPRKENGKAKTIEGPSARFAEIMASAWTNMRAEGKTIGNDGQFVTSRGTAWDVENNVAIAFEVQRRITDRNGKTYTDDMISVTGNAGASVALRNAILKVIPTAFWKPIYNECRKVIAGDVRTFAARRDDMLKHFNVMGVTTDRLLSSIGLGGVEDITLDHIVTLRGIFNALKEGETTIEEAFPEGGGLGTPQASVRKSQTTAPAHQADAKPRDTAATQTPPVTDQPSATPAHVGKIVSIDERGGAFMVKLDTGFVCSTRDQDVVADLRLHQKEGVRVDLTCTPSSDPKKFAPKLTAFKGLES